MLEIYIKLLPVFGFFLLGVILKRSGIVQREHGAVLLKFMFFVTLPALVLVKLTQTHIGLDKLSLPFMNIGINLGCMLVMLLITRFWLVERRTLGVMLVSSMIINNIFMFPFILSLLGNQAFTDVVIFDIGNAMMTMTLTYVVAFSHGADRIRLCGILANVLKLPVMWALVLAVTLNLNTIHLPTSLVILLQPLGLLTSPLILVALGVYFSPRIKQMGLVSITIFVRMVVGLVIGLTLATIFELQGDTFLVVVVCSAAPIGFNALTFASLAKLDVEFAAGVVSISILIGMIIIPLLMYYLQV